MDSESDIQWNVSSADDLGATMPAVLDPLLDEPNTPESVHADASPWSMDTRELNDALPAMAESSSSAASPWQKPHSPVVIDGAQKEVDHAQDSFVSYNVKSNTRNVRRRFRDFAWLYDTLFQHYPACFIPPLPERHRLEYVKGDRFSTEFIEKRRTRLERFLQRIERHPVLSRSEHFAAFLSTDLNTTSTRAQSDGHDTMIDTIGDSLLNAFTKVRQPDPLFVDMQDRVQRSHDTLESLERMMIRTQKRTQDLHKDYDELAKSVRGLAELETNMQTSMFRFAQGVDQYAEQIKIMSAHDADWLSEIHDSMAYNRAMKVVLKLRDQKQLDVEELTEYLQSSVKDREKLVRSGADSSNLTGFLAGKINEARGADMDKLRREKVLKLDNRIHELREAVDQADKVSQAFSNQLQKEDNYFVHNRAMEMHHSLQTYTSAKVDFYERGADAWRQVVQALEEAEQESAS